MEKQEAIIKYYSATKMAKKAKEDAEVARAEVTTLKAQLAEAKAKASDAVRAWKKTPAWREAAEDYMSRHGDQLYLGGWHACSKLVLEKYHEVDQEEIMEPVEKAKRDDRIKRAAAQGISLEELPEDDDEDDSSSTYSDTPSNGDVEEAADTEATEIDPALDMIVGGVEPTPLLQELPVDAATTL